MYSRIGLSPSVSIPLRLPAYSCRSIYAFVYLLAVLCPFVRVPASLAIDPTDVWRGSMRQGVRLSPKLLVLPLYAPVPRPSLSCSGNTPINRGLSSAYPPTPPPTQQVGSFHSALKIHLGQKGRRPLVELLLCVPRRDGRPNADEPPQNRPQPLRVVVLDAIAVVLLDRPWLLRDQKQTQQTSSKWRCQ